MLTFAITGKIAQHATGALSKTVRVDGVIGHHLRVRMLFILAMRPHHKIGKNVLVLLQVEWPE